MKPCCILRALVFLLTVAVAPALTADQPFIGQPAPGFSLTSLDGETVSDTDFAGRPIVLHFGAGW